MNSILNDSRLIEKYSSAMNGIFPLPGLYFKIRKAMIGIAELIE